MRSRFACLAVPLFVTLGLNLFAGAEFQIPNEAFTTTPKSVSIVGTFNDWGDSATPMVRDGVVWRATVAVPDGRHLYRLHWLDGAGSNHGANDPTNPCMAFFGKQDLCNILDIVDGKRVARTEGLEPFEWPPSPRKPVWVDGGNEIWTLSAQLYTTTGPAQRAKVPAKTVAIEGDLRDGRKEEIPLVLSPDGVWRAFVALRRPFTYRVHVDGKVFYDWGNDPLPSIFMAEGKPQRVEPQQVYRVPDGEGDFRSHRPQLKVTSPSLAAIERLPVAGDGAALDEVTSWAVLADYGRAVALARKVREVNTRADGKPSSLGLEALRVEGRIHKRWAKFDEAAQCWLGVLAFERDKAASHKAARELIAYYVFVRRDLDAARLLAEWAVGQAGSSKDARSVIADYVESAMQARRWTETLPLVEKALAAMPPPDGSNPESLNTALKLWLAKGSCHYYLKQPDLAKPALARAVALDPKFKFESTRRARNFLRYLGAAPASAGE